MRRIDVAGVLVFLLAGVGCVRRAGAEVRGDLVDHRRLGDEGTMRIARDGLFRRNVHVARA